MDLLNARPRRPGRRASRRPSDASPCRRSSSCSSSAARPQVDHPQLASRPSVTRLTPKQVGQVARPGGRARPSGSGRTTPASSGFSTPSPVRPRSAAGPAASMAFIAASQALSGATPKALRNSSGARRCVSPRASSRALIRLVRRVHKHRREQTAQIRPSGPTASSVFGDDAASPCDRSRAGLDRGGYGAKRRVAEIVEFRVHAREVVRVVRRSDRRARSLSNSPSTQASSRVGGKSWSATRCPVFAPPLPPGHEGDEVVEVAEHGSAACCGLRWLSRPRVRRTRCRYHVVVVRRRTDPPACSTSDRTSGRDRRRCRPLFCWVCAPSLSTMNPCVNRVLKGVLPVTLGTAG